MRKITLTAGVIVTLIMLQSVHAEDRPQTGDLTILATGFSSGSGHAMIKVMDSEHAMTNEDKAFSMIKSRIVGNRVEIVLRGIPYGEYAVSVFHDRNDNGVLDKGITGAPKEGYGFSNNAGTRLGQPDYNSMRFDFRVPSATQHIIMR